MLCFKTCYQVDLKNINKHHGKNTKITLGLSGVFSVYCEEHYEGNKSFIFLCIFRSLKIIIPLSSLPVIYKIL